MKRTEISKPNEMPNFPNTLDLLRKKFSRLRMTGTDFVSLCDACGITLKITSKVDRGFYYCTEGQHFIVLSSKLTPTRRSFVGWHEFAHFLQNYFDRKTIAAFNGVEPDLASEKLADVFAMICLRPDQIKITDRMDFLWMIMSVGQ